MPTVTLPTLHTGQVAAYRLRKPDGSRARFRAIRCGRRWGKTALLSTLACDTAARGEYFGMFAPDHKRMSETFIECKDILLPLLPPVGGAQQGAVLRTRYGGRIDFWSLDSPNAGRSRKYHRVGIDEAAFTKPDMMHVWRTAIQPTLLDYQGEAWAMSNTNGADTMNFLWRICNEPEHEFVEYHAPSMDNPLIPIRIQGETDEEWQTRRDAEFESIRKQNHPLVYKQEYLAEFVDWSGSMFFSLKDMLDEQGQPYEYPRLCDAVFATVDTAVKTGKEHDGTAVCYWAVTRYNEPRLMLLDWDVVQVEGDLLPAWLPTVFARLEELAKGCGARYGSIGAHIEDKATGMVLLQYAKRRGWDASEIDSKLTSVGKDERAISVSGYVYQKLVKMSRHAHDKLVSFKDQTRNHLMTQVFGYRVGIKQENDDLLDAFCYGIAIALGNQEGF